ncbi:MULTISPECIES: VapE domain-containing protein [Aeromonas]|uniref:p-loop ATPase n=1 Tax=Aeromonas molluscorum 848 TaxID=1268236 RepID=R1GUT3_9GAMM|nr:MULTISPECIES: VapE domain-containing protein [Aeromonas]EOD55370.1 P-loop ATPase [Aeromonas molluscorum 848]KTA80241.1 ATPase [Aeromonas salmonicida]MDE7528437.1 virulence-associated E family protein [Aeromonas salmonicida]MDE7532787.1 virulence-associated E family protein [Aeromonas salmonicida]
MNNTKNTTAGHDIPSYDGQKDGVATEQVQQAVRSVMQGELLTLPDMGPTGRPIKTSANLCALIRFQAWLPRYNLMTGEPELAGADGERLGGSEAGQRSALVDACQLAGVPDAAIDEHLIAICERHSYHPVRHWLERGAPWDGIPRIDAVIATLNAANPAYASAVLHAWLVGCVAALYQPRWNSKLVPVLAGAQSYRKSAWVSRLAAVVPGSTLDCAINPDKPDDVRRAVSAWVVELAELESTTRHEAGSLKAFLTRENDSYRLPYARSMTTKKRQTAFMATVNGSDFLRDTTGNARFAVIELAAAADLERLNPILGWSWDAGRLSQTDPEQLRQFWLEVKERYESGETWFLDDATVTLAASANDAHTDKGALYELIGHHYLSSEHANFEWLIASELCTRHGEKLSTAGAWGKALKLHASEGKIQSKKGRANQTQYRLPIVSSTGTDKIDKK